MEITEKFLAFDLDGIFVPDLNIPYSDSSFMNIWSALKPLYVPDFPIYVFTMRNGNFKEFTINWMLHHKFQLAGAEFLAGDMSKLSQQEILDTFRPEVCAQRKVDALRRHHHDVKLYIESDLEIVQHIQSISRIDGCIIPTIHFNKFLNIAIHDLARF